jgi:4-amino-4-deoxy-L-arabinose transferase-like glycosyltransferase
MRPFIVTQAEASRLPRLAMLVLVCLYLIPGLLWRDPWGRAEAEGLGIALTMARGGIEDWLAPNIFGLPFPEEGPLFAWICALAISLLGPLLGEQTAARVTIGMVVALGLFWLWRATALIASRPEVQPSDPFEASASSKEIGRAVADAALLVAMATCGLIARVHETTAEAMQFTWTAGFMWGAALALDRPVRGGLIAGAAIAASALTRGLPTGASLAIVLMLLPVCSQRYQWVAKPMFGAALASAAMMMVPWPLALYFLGEEGAAWLRAWWGWNAAELGLGSIRSLIFLIRNLPWYLWPSWPLAIWAAWHWRHRWQSPAITLPLLMAASALVFMLLTPLPSESMMQPPVVPFAVLAALGLPAIRRGLVSLLDWTAVATFSLLGFVIWAYWFALHTGFPPRMADSAARLAPGFNSDAVAVQTAVGLAVSVGWLALVWWRTSRRPRMIWRPMVLSCGGLVLNWVLLIALWLPVHDARVSYRRLATEIAQVIGQANGCVRAEPLEPAIRSNLAYFGSIRFAQSEEPCDWLLSRIDIRAGVTPAASMQWIAVWQGRRAFDSTEQFTLYRRGP